MDFGAKLNLKKVFLEFLPTGVQEASKSSQERPKSTPRAPKSVPRAPKSGPRAAKRGPRAPQERSRAAQEPPKGAQERPKEAQEQPKAAYGAAKSDFFQWFWKAFKKTYLLRKNVQKYISNDSDNEKRLQTPLSVHSLVRFFRHVGLFFRSFFRVVFLFVLVSFWGAILGRFWRQNRVKNRTCDLLIFIDFP